MNEGGSKKPVAKRGELEPVVNDRIRALAQETMRERGLNQTELAKTLGLELTSVNRLMTGRGTSLALIRPLARLTGLSLDYLLSEQESAAPVRLGPGLRSHPALSEVAKRLRRHYAADAVETGIRAAEIMGCMVPDEDVLRNVIRVAIATQEAQPKADEVAADAQASEELQSELIRKQERRTTKARRAQ